MMMHPFVTTRWPPDAFVVRQDSPQSSPISRAPSLQRNEEAAKEGRPLELFWRRQYVPQEGMFRDPPADLQLGTRLPEVCGQLRRWPSAASPASVALCALCTAAPPLLMQSCPLVSWQRHGHLTRCRPCLPRPLLQGDGKPEKGVRALADGKGFVKDGQEYRWARATGQLAGNVHAKLTVPSPARPARRRVPTTWPPAPAYPQGGRLLVCGSGRV